MYVQWKCPYKLVAHLMQVYNGSVPTSWLPTLCSWELAIRPYSGLFMEENGCYEDGDADVRCTMQTNDYPIMDIYITIYITWSYIRLRVSHDWQMDRNHTGLSATSRFVSNIKVCQLHHCFSSLPAKNCETLVCFHGNHILKFRLLLFGWTLEYLTGNNKRHVLYELKNFNLMHFFFLISNWATFQDLRNPFATFSDVLLLKFFLQLIVWRKLLYKRWLTISDISF